MQPVLKPFEQLPFAQVPELPRISHPYFDAVQRRVTVRSQHFGNVQVHVSVFGEGPPLLLLHGLMTASYSFRYLLEPLGKHFTLYMPDLIGAGRSDKPRTSYGPEDLARSVGEVMRELGIWGAPAIGNSMGGYLLMRLALQDPSAMSRLVNLHSPGIPTARMSEGGVAAFSRHLRDTLAVTEMRRFERKLATLERFPIPLLLVYARQDKMVPPAVGERLARLIPDARIEWLDRASHFAQVDAPEALLRASLPFLQEGR